MIYNIQTFCTYGYWPEDLRPNSTKPIIAACNRCGKVKITTKNRYYDLCLSCAQKKRFSNPLEHEKISIGLLRYFEDNPVSDETKEKLSKINKSRYEDPKEREKTSEAGLKYYENNPISDEIKKQRGKALSEYRKDNPISDETRKKQSEAQQRRFKDPVEREKTRERTMKAYKDDPTIIEQITESVKQHYNRMDDPGQEICMHHYIYDFGDLNKYTIPVTRSEHTSIHWNLKRAGLEVPCINIMKDD